MDEEPAPYERDNRNMSGTITDSRGRPLRKISLEKRVELRKLYLAQTPRWRRPLIGFFASVPVVGLGVGVVLLAKYLLPSNFYFPGLPLTLSVLLVALFWGVGPALFSILLSALALDYFYFPPYGAFGITTWNGLLQVLPFVIAWLVIAIITGQRESARLRALMAEEEAIDRADELALANQKLEQANRLKDQFLSMASHELKTPITIISGHAQIALRRLSKQRDLPPELAITRTALEKIGEQTQRLDNLVDDLLDLSSIRAGKIGLQLGQCDLLEVCRVVVEDQRLLNSRTIELESPSSPLKLQGDCDRLSQVIVNLVSNAIKYSPEESHVKVRVDQRDSVAIIQVQDTGKGIPKNHQAHIFEPFYRVPGAQTSSKRGMGLGLAISKDIVERHGGRIWFESQPGQGTTFFVELPLR
jgi:signal transduction histidine kinase